jgi:hypothetical protein
MKSPEVSRARDEGHDLDLLRAEARYQRERYDLLRAKAYGGRAVAPSRLRELQRRAEGAAARLKRAEDDRRRPSPDTTTT